MGKNLTHKIQIAILAGGWSGEREISLESGEAVYRALDREKYSVTLYDPLNDLELLIKEKDRIDLAFVLMHGKYGEDGCIQGFLELLNIPFVGSGVLTSAMAMNKKIAKEIYGADGVVYTGTAPADIAAIEKAGNDKQPICMAKTQHSITDDPAKKGAPKGWTLTVREVRLSNGAGFIVPLTGKMMTIPGLPTTPAAERIDIDDNGYITGLN